MHRLLAPWVLLVVLCAAVTHANAQTPRDEAVLRARAGDMAGALQALRGMIAAGTYDRLVAMDLVTLLQQDGKAAEAVAVWERAADRDPPEYALLAATRAYRDVRRYNEASALARQGLDRFPGSDVWPVLLALTLTDAGRTQEALETLRRYGRRANPLERRLAEAYAFRRAGDNWAALRAYAEANRISPNNKEARSEVAGLLRELRGPFGAGRFMAPSRSLEANQAASLVTWGADIRSPDPARRFEGTDLAIARLDALIAAERVAETPDAGLIRRMRLDRLVAYRDRVRMAELVAEADQLRQESSPLPAYAREAVGDALLYLRRPEDALVEYEAVLAESPREPNARYGRFYALVEMEALTRAREAADAILADTAIWQRFGDEPARYPNVDYPYAALRAAQVRLWSNQVADGYERLVPLATAAPANQALRSGMTGAFSARGWPRAADEEAHIAASLGPDNLGAKLALAEMALVRRRLPEATERTEALVRLYPEDLGVQRLARDLDAARSFLLELEVRPAKTSGGGINSAGNELTSTWSLTSPPIGDIWHVFVLGGFSFSHPVEGYASRLMSGAGVEVRLPDWTARLYAAGNGGTLARAGGGASVDWTPTDQISLGVSGQLFSTETPLRALLYGITTNQVTAAAAYRWDETREAKATVSYLPFSDGNRRVTGGLGLSQRVLSLPHFDLTARADLYASRNSKPGGPYYSPPRDFSATGGLTAQHVIWRRYDQSLVPVLTLDAGSYSEQGFTTTWIGAAAYEQRWRFDPRTEFYYGVSLSRRVYDGSPERAVALLFGLRQRL